MSSLNSNLEEKSRSNNQMAEENKADWSSLPGELVLSIANRLPTQSDILRFRAVCRPWRSSIPVKKTLPSHLSLPIPNGHIRVVLYTLYQVSYKSGEFDSTRIVKLKIRKSGKCCLVDPLCQIKLTMCGTHLQNEVNLLDKDNNVSELCTVARVKWVQRHECRPDDKDFNLFVKIVISEDKNTALAVCQRGKLCFWRLDEDAYIIVDKYSNRYADVVSYKGGFCAVEDTGRAVLISRSLELIEIASPFCEHSDQHLVLSSGDLILVSIFYVNVGIFIRKLSTIKVHKLNEDKCQWDEMNNLDGRILLLGNDFTVSMSAVDFEGCEGNFILSMVHGYGALPDNSINSASLVSLEDGEKQRVRDFPNYSRILRPPESWFHWEN